MSGVWIDLDRHAAITLSAKQRYGVEGEAACREHRTQVDPGR